MPSLLLLLPSDNTYRYGGGAFRRSYSYAPLTLSTLAGLVPASHGFTIDLVDEGVQHTGDGRKNYDIVGITCTTSSANRAYDLCKFWRRKGAYAVLGGAHPTLMPQEAMLHADTVIVGPAEEIWPAFLADYKNGCPNRIYRNDGDASINGPYPLPRRDLIRKGLYLDAPTVIARPGCTNGCDFCAIPCLGQTALAAREIEDVVREIRGLDRNRILFLDPNITADRPYAKKLFRALIPLHLQWAGLVSADAVADESLVELMVESGCAGLLIGFESLIQDNLTSARKKFAQIGEYAKAIRLLHQGGISVLGCFVLGFDYDTAENLDDLPALVDDLEVDLPRYSILTPFPGTVLYKRLELEGRILTTDWSLYDTEHVVFRPARIEPENLQSALYHAWSQSYSLQNVAKRSLRLKKNRIFGVLANLGLRRYGKRLYTLRKETNGLIHSDQLRAGLL
jgi:radical SAM superfamily enzyme YgiQ (UPF0313 family)